MEQAQDSLVPAMSQSRFLSDEKARHLTLHFRVYLNALESDHYLIETSTANFNFNFQFQSSTSYSNFKLELQLLA